MTAAPVGLRPPLASVAFLGVLWVQFLWVLSHSWNDATYYSYGWVVPPAIVLFAWRRWQDLPAGSTTSASAHRWPWILVAAATLLLIPLRIVEHVDIYWRLPLWLHAVLVLGITHLTLGLLHGRRASVALLPATLFLLLAVPLPSAIEQRLVSTLTQAVLDLSSSLLPLFGYPAVLLGASFVVRGELLDVAEGCSGIRSFQSGMVAALALGELLRFTALRRLLLVLGAVAFAILGNTGRIVALTRHAYHEGRTSMEAIHDAVGAWAITLTYLALALLAFLLTLHFRPKTRTKRVSG